MENYKGYIIEREGTYSHYVVKFDGKGSVGDSMLGYFTKPELARQSIDRYLDDKKTEKKPSLIEDIRAGKA